MPDGSAVDAVAVRCGLGCFVGIGALGLGGIRKGYGVHAVALRDGDEAARVTFLGRIQIVISMVFWC